MVECCCDYGICRREYKEVLSSEFSGDTDLIEFSPLDGADWALRWIPNHMRDMHDAACEHFLRYNEYKKAVNHGL